MYPVDLRTKVIEVLDGPSKIHTDLRSWVAVSDIYPYYA